MLNWQRMNPTSGKRMEAEKSKAGKWVDDSVNLLETYRDLTAIRIVEQVSLGASVSVLGIIALLFAVCILLFVGLGAAWWVGQETGNTALGLFIVGGAYLILFSVLLVTAPKYLIPVIRDLIIKKIYEQD